MIGLIKGEFFEVVFQKTDNCIAPYNIDVIPLWGFHTWRLLCLAGILGTLTLLFLRVPSSVRKV